MDNIEDINYLAATLVGEARGDAIESIVGVASVIRNRHFSSGKSYKEICLAPKQFSCWNDEGRPLEVENNKFVRNFLSRLENGDDIEDPILRQCLVVAKAIVNHDFPDNTKGSKNYVTTSRFQTAQIRRDPNDRWINRMKVACVLGKHVFLVEKEESKSVAS